MEAVKKLQERVEAINATFEARKEKINRQRQENFAKIKVLNAAMVVTSQQIHDIKEENKRLCIEFGNLCHEKKEATLPLRTKIWQYMEALRKEIRIYEANKDAE